MLNSKFLLHYILITLLLSINKIHTAEQTIATEGEPWPLPFFREFSNEYYCLNSEHFQFQIIKENCDILKDAIIRYKKILENEAYLADTTKFETKDSDEIKISNQGACIQHLHIHLMNACEDYPHFPADESYDLSLLSKNNVTLVGNSIWGILRGLETFSQLVSPPINGSRYLTLRGQVIKDHPRLIHRGLLLDTSRHYLPIKDILITLDAMSYNKLNVFHWHIVDDHSFPYVSNVFPLLSTKGAYHPSMVYKANDIEKIVEYARIRGIRVLPEFDTPGHTLSWGRAFPKLLTTCYGPEGKPTGELGPMNPTNEELYEFIKKLLDEINNRFPDKYVHLGGDEVDFDCWKSNPEIAKFMEQKNISDKFEKLEEHYIQRLVDIAAELNIIPIVWQEVFVNDVKMHNGTIVQVWLGDWRKLMNEITKAGHPVILSECWYLDNLKYGGDWNRFYDCDPFDFLAESVKQKDLVIGGEVCMWSEYINKNNVHSRIWPRASAAAERLWSSNRQNLETAAQRLEEHACRMNKRNIPAQPPNGPGFCIY